MLDIPSILIVIAKGLEVLKTVGELYYPDKISSKVEAMLVEQNRAKEMIEKHEEDIFKLSEKAQQADAEMARLRSEAARSRSVSCWAIGLAGLSVLLAVLAVVRK
jgi:uncharacterized protein YaiI (UPF0178 family)